MNGDTAPESEPAPPICVLCGYPAGANHGKGRPRHDFKTAAAAPAPSPGRPTPPKLSDQLRTAADVVDHQGAMATAETIRTAADEIDRLTAGAWAPSPDPEPRPMTAGELSEMASMARAGLHDLLPYWTPDHGDVDPLDDPEVRVEVRRYIGARWRALEAIRDGRALGADPEPGA